MLLEAEHGDGHARKLGMIYGKRENAFGSGDLEGFAFETKMGYKKHIGCLWKPMRGEMCVLNKCKL